MIEMLRRYDDARDLRREQREKGEITMIQRERERDRSVETW